MPRLGKLVKGHRYQVGRFAGSWYVVDLDRNRMIYGPFMRRETAEARIHKIVHMSRRNPKHSRRDVIRLLKLARPKATRTQIALASKALYKSGTIKQSDFDHALAIIDSESTSIPGWIRKASRRNPDWKQPLTQRKRKRLGVLYRKAFSQFSKENPRRGTLIYGRVLKIFAEKTTGPYKGQQFVHIFKRGAIMVGMPDGSLRITHP